MFREFILFLIENEFKHFVVGISMNINDFDNQGIECKNKYFFEYIASVNRS